MTCATNDIRVNVEGSPEAVADFFLRLGMLHQSVKSNRLIKYSDVGGLLGQSKAGTSEENTDIRNLNVSDTPTNDDNERDLLKSILTERGIEFSPRARLATLKKLVEDSDDSDFKQCGTSSNTIELDGTTYEDDSDDSDDGVTPEVMENPAATILQKTGKEDDAAEDTQYQNCVDKEPDEQANPVDTDRSYTLAEFIDECKRYCHRVMQSGKDINTSHKMLADILMDMTGNTRRVIEVEEIHYNAIVKRLHDYSDILQDPEA